MRLAHILHCRKLCNGYILAVALMDICHRPYKILVVHRCINISGKRRQHLCEYAGCHVCEKLIIPYKLSIEYCIENTIHILYNKTNKISTDSWNDYGIYQTNFISEQKTKATQWFHTDCISAIHNVPAYSEQHWELIDKYMAMASELGINMILTPVITPPLDTGVGVERPNVQLVRMEKKGDKYEFDFSLLHRWIELAKSNGMKYFEISHLFSQWGLEYAPNIYIYEDGELKQ